MTMMRLSAVSTIVLLFATTVTGFTFDRSVIVPATRQLQLQQQRIPTLVTAATASSNEEATTTSSSNNVDSAVDTAATSDDTATATTSNTQPLIIVNGHNIELTSSLVEYINKRIGNILSKLANHGAVRECDVILSVNKNPKVNFIVYIYILYIYIGSLTPPLLCFIIF
jgi:Sigma 54 modulation protein / S30EA ribosomal protein